MINCLKQKTALVLGAGGFIGNHMVTRLKEEGYWVRGVDLKYPEFGISKADHFVIRDLREQREVEELIGYAGCNRNPYQIYASKFDVPFDEIYQFAADMGGAGYVFSGNHDADIMHNSVTINLNLLNALVKKEIDTTKVFYSSSACIYPEHNQANRLHPICREDTAYPANPDSEYGWEKLFSERLYMSYNKNYGIPVRVARFHNIYGPEGTWRGGKEKAPAAICRKVLERKITGKIAVWGTGEQTRSFLYIDDCIDAVRLLMESDYLGPINIGSEEMVSINELVDKVCLIEDRYPVIENISGPVGVYGRCSDNRLIERVLGWKPKVDLKEGIEKTYRWIEGEMKRQ